MSIKLISLGVILTGLVFLCSFNLVIFLFSGANSVGQRLEEIEPAVDFPVQFNFGSPYSSSLTVFFDFEEPREIGVRSTEN